MDPKKSGGIRVAGTGRFVTIVPKTPMTKAGLTRVHEALTKAAEQTGTFRSSATGRYGDRKLPPKSK